MIVGPWKCEQCGQLSQFAVKDTYINRIFCRNESCGFTRTVDKHRKTIIENDGTFWEYDGQGNKRQVSGR